MSNPFPENDPQHLFWQKIPKNDSAEARLDVAQTVAINEMSQGWKWILEPNQEIQEAHERGVEREIGAKPHFKSPNHSLESVRKPALQNSVEWAWILPPKEKEEFVKRKTREYFQDSGDVDHQHTDSASDGWQYRSDSGVVEVVELEDDEIPPRQPNAQY